MSGANSTIGISKVILQYKVSGRYSASDADVLAKKYKRSEFYRS